MGDWGDLGPQRRLHDERYERGLNDDSVMRQLLRICRNIEAQVTSKRRLEAENNRLTTLLNHVEANFLLLLRTGQSEIAKLKLKISSNVKRCAHSTRRSKSGSLLNPHRIIDRLDLIECLHTPLDYETSAHSKSTLYSKCLEAKNSLKSSSLSSGSSSGSSTSSSSSLSSSSMSAPHQPHPSHNQQSPPSSTIALQHPLTPISSCNRSPNDKSSVLSSRISSRCMKPYKASDYPASGPEEPIEAESHNQAITDASTGVDSGSAAHLMNLVQASILSSREHQFVPVRLAPPSWGKKRNEKEKTIIDSYFQVENERCAAASKRPHSQSPRLSKPFSPTLFTRRQMLKHSSLCSSIPSSLRISEAAATSDPGSSLPPKNLIASRTSPNVNTNGPKANAGNMESVSPPTSFSTTVAGAPHTFEEGEEKEYDGIKSDVVARVKEQESQQQKIAKGNQAPNFDGVDNDHIQIDSPRIEIEADISDIDSRPDAEEGEIKDEDEDAPEEDTRRDRTDNIKNHRKLHRSSLNHIDQRPRDIYRFDAVPRHSMLSKSSYHDPHHRVITSHERRRNVEESQESLPAKRSRRRSGERQNYRRLRNSPPFPSPQIQRAHRCPRYLAPPLPVFARRRFPSTGGGSTKFSDFLARRTRASPAIVSRRSPAVVFRRSRRSFAQQR